MTLEEYLAAEIELDKQWAIDSNATEDQDELFRLAEGYIEAHKVLMQSAGGHPKHPRPRVRP